MEIVTALCINDDGTLGRKELTRMNDGAYVNRAGSEYVKSDATTTLMGWGCMDGKVIGLVDKHYPRDDGEPEYWVSDDAK